MTIHAFEPQTDSTAADSTAYDSVWTETNPPAAQPDALERVFTADGKIYVVVAVLIIVWIGIMAYIYRTDQKIDALERRLDDSLSEGDA
ncbi:MAG: CcmD family protein [Longimonas sp.]|uniref:CcmD family protein n=1 Tax=Longimonas sp. TaxID=2039626 RepID=UPI0039749B5D